MGRARPESRAARGTRYVSAGSSAADHEAPFAALTPDRILDCVEACGCRANGRLLALNSYENRVYRVGLDDGGAVIAKFYRPGRWGSSAILEEHAFALELADAEIPVVPPLVVDGRTLHSDGELRFALFPNRPGRPPELDRDDTLRRVGRLLGRLHACGAVRRFRYRERLSLAHHGRDPVEFLLAENFIPPELRAAYEAAARACLSRAQAVFDAVGDIREIRLHGDCHAGNLLWTDAGPHFVDLDDCMTGPAIQDLWLLLAGDEAERARQMRALLDGYEDFYRFDRSELGLIEALRTLRILHYAAWLARRWNDPAFPLHFPWFNTQRYWQDHVLILREQIAAMDEPPLCPDA